MPPLVSCGSCRHSPRSSPGPDYLSAPSIKDFYFLVEDVPLAPLHLPDLQSVSSSPHPPRCPPPFSFHSTLYLTPRFPCASPWFRELQVVPGDLRGSWAVHDPPCGSACKGRPLAFAAGRCRNFCTGASTCSACTSDGCSNSHMFVWMIPSSNQFNIGCCCSTNKPIKGLFCIIKYRFCTVTSRRSSALPFYPPHDYAAFWDDDDLPAFAQESRVHLENGDQNLPQGRTLVAITYVLYPSVLPHHHSKGYIYIYIYICMCVCVCMCVCMCV